MIFARAISTKTKIKTGTFSLNNQAIGGTSDYTLLIPLGRSDFKQGYLVFMLPNSVSGAYARRNTAFISFTTDINYAISRSSGISTYSVYGYVFRDQWIKGYAYNLDSVLSEYRFDTIGSYARIKSCQIVGSNIELIFYNRHSISLLLTIEGRYNVTN